MTATIDTAPRTTATPATTAPVVTTASAVSTALAMPALPATAPAVATRRTQTAPGRRRRARAGGSLRALRTAAALVLLAALLAALGALVVVPRLTGWVPLTVLSGSMEPTIPTGSQVVVAPIQGEEDAAGLQVGDVITVMPYPEDPTLVTHRIVERIDAAAGVSFVTQGDANDVADDWEVDATQIRAQVRYWVPGAGYVATSLAGQRETVTLVVAGALLLYAAGQAVAALRGRRRTTDA